MKWTFTLTIVYGRYAGRSWLSHVQLRALCSAADLTRAAIERFKLGTIEPLFRRARRLQSGRNGSCNWFHFIPWRLAICSLRANQTHSVLTYCQFWAYRQLTHEKSVWSTVNFDNGRKNTFALSTRLSERSLRRLGTGKILSGFVKVFRS